MVNSNDNFTELKRLFDAECERLKVETDKVKAHLGGGEHLTPAVTLVKLLDGHSLDKTKKILSSSFHIVDRLVDKANREAFKINAVEVEGVL